MQFTPSCLALVAVGLILFIGLKLFKIQRKRPDDFNPLIYWRHNYILIILSVFFAYTVQYFADIFATGILDIHVHSGSNFYEVFAVQAGFNNQWLFTELMKKK